MNPGEAMRQERMRKKSDWYLEKENLYAFSEEICDYDRLVDEFHGPICTWLA